MVMVLYLFYSISTAEEIKVIDNDSACLVTAGRAIQYFDFPRFFDECKRILKPNGVVAFYSSDHVKFVIEENPEIADKLNDLFRKVT